MKTLNVILTHQKRVAVESMISWWENRIGNQPLLIAYGGSAEDFESLAFYNKLFVPNKRLLTKDHQRERQSYQTVFQVITDSGFTDQCDYVHFAEYDQVPLQKDVNLLQAAFLESEKADAVGYRLQRVDQTNNAHYLSHAADRSFIDFIRSISVRQNPHTVLSMLGLGGFWSKQAFQAVARIEEPLPIYLELFMPTIAHHLGFRLRPIPDSPYISINKRFTKRDLERAKSSGEWFIHPVKDQWPVTTT